VKVSDAGPLDPSHYVEHVTRTALLLEQLARDVKSLREQTEYGLKDISGLRTSLTLMERDLAVFKVDMGSKVATNHETIDGLGERLRWLVRVVVGALLTGIVGGTIALIFKLLG
jgi:hypothetical protein